jgi:glycosyltransferase involved in cell wall biosynthesis
MKNKITLSIGIPAHNEESNISHLLDRLIAQKQTSYTLEKIYVVLDGCTDKTAEIVSEYAKNYVSIKLVNDKKRLGKAQRLNMMYTMNKSDLLATFDADILPETNMELEKLVKAMIKNKKSDIAVPRYIPIKPDTLWGWFSYISFVSFEDAYMQLNSGNNHYAIMGCASVVRKKLSKSFTYPKATISDHAYLYRKATKNNKNGMVVVNEAHILFKTVSTFKDWRVSGIRSVVMDKQNAVDLMGEDVLKLYSMPKFLYFKSLVKWFFKYPFYSAGSLILNIYIRLFPLKMITPKNGVWEITESNKKLKNK